VVIGFGDGRVEMRDLASGSVEHERIVFEEPDNISAMSERADVCPRRAYFSRMKSCGPVLAPAVVVAYLSGTRPTGDSHA
jgi:ribose-5-phosphate isomerase (EC 5.3.1.6)